MTLKTQLESSVDEIIRTAYNERDGRVVPESEDVTFLGDAVKLKATFLYADLADSTALAKRTKISASDTFRCFLNATSRVILSESGAIRSFDGDRVMAVFIGDTQRTTAVRCALKIHWAFLNIVRPKLVAGRGAELASLNYGVGIDTGDVWAVRGGVRNNSDLVWVGAAPNLAAKLSAIRCNSYRTRITSSVYDYMESSAKYSKGVDMWERQDWKDQATRYYRSSYSWEIT